MLAKILLTTLFFLFFQNLTISKESEEGDSLIYFRSRWFYGQRQFPFDSIPINAYRNAIEDRQYSISQGYFFDYPMIWTSIGPMPINAPGWGWDNAGRGSVIKFDPNNSSTIYIGAGNGGLWRTTDGGHNWIPLTDFFQTLSSGALAIDPENSQIMYYGTGEAIADVIYTYLGLGVFKTTDGGQNWNQLSNGLPTSGTSVYKIEINPENSNIIFVAMKTGLYRSDDTGLNWIRVVPSTGVGLKCSDIVISPNNSNVVYCAGPSYNNGGVGYRRSTDGGLNFEIITDQNFHPTWRTELAVGKSDLNTDIVYAITNTGEQNPTLLSIFIYINLQMEQVQNFPEWTAFIITDFLS